MNYLLRYAIGALALAGLLHESSALADALFTIDDPPVDFEVIDAEPFDGAGDNGPYYTFNDAVLGTEGEARSMAEFDIAPFSVPPGESITAATLEVRISSVYVFGLGVDGETPDHLIVDGYVGDGIEALGDFQAGDGNMLDEVATPAPWVGQVIGFDITAFVTALVDAHESYIGLTVRAGSFGGLMMEEGYGYPKLTITTTSETSAPQSIESNGARLLRGSSPNPFSVFTRIEYEVPRDGAGPMLLSIHDATGRLVCTLAGGSQQPGVHDVVWNGTDRSGAAAASGVYFFRARWEGKSEVRRMLLVR